MIVLRFKFFLQSKSLNKEELRSQADPIKISLNREKKTKSFPFSSSIPPFYSLPAK
jgi:hypothetical protein